jgi:conjugal transfer pilus assembly protein TraF
LKEDAERGWFFYERDESPEPREPIQEEEEPLRPQKEPEPTKEEKCSKKETWTVDCGFVDPGKDFDFQAKQRDALLQAMSMSKNDPQAVENFQYYMKWLMERSIEVANLWQYNLAQNPELDANVKSPINSFGLRLMTEVRDDSEESILNALKKEGAFLVYFSRYDCAFCHAMTSMLDMLQDKTGLEIWNTALDEQCMPSFQERCRSGQKAVMTAQALQVSIVPTLFLYVPGAKAESDTWIRIATGVTDYSTMRGRIVSFFTAYRTALLKGVANGGPNRAPVDFSGIEPTGAAIGVSPAGTTGPRLPTEEEIKKLLAQ